MGLLDSVFNIVVNSQTTSPSKPGFGTALLLSYHTHWTNRVRSYSGVAGMTSDGFAVTDPEYIFALAYFGQKNAPKALKIGRRATFSSNQQTNFKILASPPTGATISLSINGTVFTHSVASETATQVATAIAAAITAALPTNVQSATSSSDTVTISASAQKLINVVNLAPTLAVLTLITNQDPTADLVACAAEDNDWYALALTSADNADAVHAAVWAEANKKLFITHSADDACVDGTSTTDEAYALKAASYGRTGFFFHRSGGTLSTIVGAILGSRLVADPGSDTWAYKTLIGITPDPLTASEIAALQAKRASYYVASNNVSFTQGGQVAGGDWLDVVRGLDWFRSELQIAQFTLALNREKIPFTDPGIALVRGTLKAVCTRAERQGLFTDNSTVVTTPLAADVAQSDKAARNLPGILIAGQLAGAIHTTTVTATVTV